MRTQPQANQADKTFPMNGPDLVEVIDGAHDALDRHGVPEGPLRQRIDRLAGRVPVAEAHRDHYALCGREAIRALGLPDDDDLAPEKVGSEIERLWSRLREFKEGPTS